MDPNNSAQPQQPNTNLQFTGEPTPPPMTPPVEMKKKSNKGLIIAIILVLFIGGCVAMLFLLHQPESNRKVADESQESKPEPKNPEKQPDEDNYNLGEILDNFSFGDGDLAFKTPEGAELLSVGKYYIIMKPTHDSKTIGIGIRTEKPESSPSFSQKLCLSDGDYTAGRTHGCKVLTEVGLNGYDYFQRNVIEEKDGTIRVIYDMYFQLNQYYISYNYFANTLDEEKQIEIINNIKDAFSIDENVPNLMETAFKQLPTPMNKQLNDDIFRTISLETGSYELTRKISDKLTYTFVVYYEPISEEGYTQIEHDKENNIDIYKKDDEVFFRFNQDNVDVTAKKLEHLDNDDSPLANITVIATIEEIKEALATLPDKE